MTFFSWEIVWQEGKPVDIHKICPAIRSVQEEGCPNLAGVKPGSQARITGFSERLSSDRRAHLQAYGLVPGSWVQVAQQSPVTVVQIDNLELALEKDLAKSVQVETR